MTATYVAWNGEPYPWPPPDGWYQADDGRWWAPGSGPDPHRGTAPDAGLHQSGSEAVTEHQGQDQQTVLNSARRNTLPGFDEVTRSLAAAAAETEAEGHRITAGQAGSNEPSEHDRHGGGGHRRDGTRGVSGGAVVWLTGLGLVVLLGAGLGFLAVRNPGTGSNTPSTTALVSGEAAPPTTLLIDDRTQTEPPPSTTTTQSTTTQSTTPPLTEQSTLNDQTSATTTAPTPDNEALVAAWRSELAGHNIDSDALSDVDIIDFGKSFCVFAVVSIDSDEFDEFRDKAQTGVAGSLTEPQLNAAIDAAVITFCPEDAARLGIAP